MASYFPAQMDFAVSAVADRSGLAAVEGLVVLNRWRWLLVALVLLACVVIVVAATTTIIYPIESGTAAKAGTDNKTFSDLMVATGSASGNSSTTLIAPRLVTYTGTETNKFYTGQVGIFVIDSSVLPDDNTIDSAYLNVTVESTITDLGSFTAVLTNGTYSEICGDISWNWSFGDGTTSTDQNPSHTYTTAGNYTVSLNVSGTSPVIVDFSANETYSTSAPMDVQFTDTSTFGAGETEYNTSTKIDYILIGPGPSAAFTAIPLNGTAPLNVSFTDESTGTPTSRYWEFDQYLANSTEQNPFHEFNTVGNYSVRLQATNAYGSSWENKTNYIQVLPAWGWGNCTESIGNLSISFLGATNSSLAYQWEDPANITAVTWDGFYLPYFDNHTANYTASGLPPDSWHRFRMYNITGEYGERNCTTDPIITPTPTPYIPDINPSSESSNPLIDYWWVWLILIGGYLLFRRG